MAFYITSFITNPFVLLFLSVFIGEWVGKLKLGSFKLGNSGGLFSGLFIGWYVYKKYALPYKNIEHIPAFAQDILGDGVVPKYFFIFTLILFIASVGLLASKDLGKVLKKYGLKFVFLGFIITFTGAALCYIMTLIAPGQNAFAIVGVYTGALTSSPGLAAALEKASFYGKEAESMIGFGYALGYIPGVLIVICSIQFFPSIFKINLENEKKHYQEEMYTDDENEIIEKNFDLFAFAFTCFIGLFLGDIKIYLGPIIKYFSLGTTGGVLISSLLLGYIGKLGPMNFRMNKKVLGVMRELSLSLFLTTVGLRYGYTAIHSILSSGGYLLFISFLCGLFSLLVGYIIGRYLFKINWVILSGALCGGMTSTPGLGAAIDTVKSDNVTAGYGTTYPFALLGMIIFTILLYKFI